jgi:hypothetical protein
MKVPFLLPLVILICCSRGYGELIWKQSIVELRAGRDDRELTAVFPFEAEGQRTTILSIRTTCGCTSVALPKKTYEQGETGELKVIFDVNGRYGQQRKSVYVQTDDPKTPVKELTLKAFIPQLVAIQPRMLYWVKGSQEYETQTIDLVFDEPDIRISNVTSDQSQLNIEWDQDAQNQRAKVKLTPSVPEGEKPFFRAVIRIELESDGDLRESVFYVYAIIKNVS